MHEKHLYDYAVLRVVPKVEREEFVNVGLMLLCKRQKYLRIEYQIPIEKIMAFCSEFDIEQVQINVDSFVKICKGKSDGGPIGQFPIEERFRWLTAVKSSSIQTSRPHSGFSSDLDATFEKLYAELVL
ncbi:DUF3037 domain-containing protein [Flavobacterium sp. F372]|jgi:hypothetical protein|uniref:DUF3037 domain-containing protein n=1 Tax=Flavobacterium bernardetii TaxID=2813823 RepID=A0ABR7IZQ7_9FLAO|nr:DUF3037 domain-containing protein [Flavobacterium bernardetii]MBC5835281.1 DUF3037 domain-containing protein [Flavobacterium bernardetii]NHF69626.1 DUF3037 domain-containing protein [Flavobacterium bernardetii]